MSSLRALRSLASSSSRALASRGAQRTLTFAAARPQAALCAKAVAASRTFSVSARVFGEGATDIALVSKLKEEIKYEKEAAAEAGVPQFIQDFQSSGTWKIEDSDGHDEVTLTRTFGNETIRVMFSIADIEGQPEVPAEEDGEMADEESAMGGFPIRCNVAISKGSGVGAVTLDTLCQEGAFVVENISFYKDAQLGTALTAEADWKRRGLYIGPQFEQLDPGVQEEFEKFLEERGVGESLALFIPEYAEYKEQKEYVGWLDNVKNFVEA